MSTTLEEKTKEIERILVKYNKKPENSTLISEVEYWTIVEYFSSLIPNVKQWRKTPWNPLYGQATDIIYYRNLTVHKEEITQPEKRIAYFERVTRKNKDILPKDIWYTTITGKDIDMPLEQAVKWAVKGVRALRDSEPDFI